MAALAVLGVLSTSVTPTAGQQPRGSNLEVLVTDRADQPLQNVEVTVKELGLTVLTDSAGRLHLLRMPPGKVELIATLFGFESDSSVVRLRPGRSHLHRFALQERAIAVEGLTVSVKNRDEQLDVLRGFESRRDRGIGFFMTRAEIEESGTNDLSNLLHMVPGFRTSPSQFGQSRMRAARTPITRRCEVKVYVDGMKYRNPSDVAGIPTRDIEALEVYRSRSELPAQFADIDTNCGAIVIWTRRYQDR